MDIAFDFSQNHKQSAAWRYLMLENNDKAVELLFGGAKYGGKSWFGCSFCFAEACRLIEIYKIKPSKFPIPVGFMGRKVAKDFSDTTLETWKKCIPQEAYVIKGTPPDIIIANAVKIITGGLDRSEDIQKFNSAELAFYFIDQAEETDRNDVMALRAATFWRLLLGKRKVPGKGLLTANPAQCWLKEEFIIKSTETPAIIQSQKFIKSSGINNKYLSKGYLSKITDILKADGRTDLLNVLKGSWA